MDGSKVCPFGTCARLHPGHLPLAALPPMESAIHDVYSHLNRPGCYGHEKSRRWVETATIYAYSRGNLLRGDAISHNPFGKLRNAPR